MDSKAIARGFLWVLKKHPPDKERSTTMYKKVHYNYYSLLDQ